MLATSLARNRAPKPAALRIDLFCRVIDNFGDVGVCWRLARQLSGQFGHRVRFIVDDLRPFSLIEPAVCANADRQHVATIELVRWSAVEAGCDADVVIEAFACDPPQPYIESMAAREAKPVWLNLEYLSAEAWVEGVHGLPSPHPKLPLTKYFFCPGFAEKTGGLIRERSVRATTGITIQDSGSIKVFAFTYPHAPVRALVHALSLSRPSASVTLSCKLNAPDDEWTQRAGVPQSEFDALLSAHDFLLVRGEDSFVRAQYAGKPMLWHIYPTDDQAHVTKLDAWLNLYCAAMPADTAAVYRRASHAFIARDHEDADEAFCALTAHLDLLQKHALNWANDLIAREDLASRMLRFVAEIATQQSKR